MSGYRLVLPWPPSTNRLWRHVMIGKSMRTIVSREGRNYKAAVQLACMEQGAPKGMAEKVAMRIKLEPPDKRCRDIDNALKALLDSLTSARVWQDDSQVDDLHVYRAGVVPGGRVTVEIWRAE